VRRAVPLGSGVSPPRPPLFFFFLVIVVFTRRNYRFITVVPSAYVTAPRIAVVTRIRITFAAKYFHVVRVLPSPTVRDVGNVCRTNGPWSRISIEQRFVHSRERFDV